MMKQLLRLILLAAVGISLSVPLSASAQCCGGKEKECKEEKECKKEKECKEDKGDKKTEKKDSKGEENKKSGMKHG